MSPAASIRLCVCLSAAFLSCGPAQADNWPDFRGPTGLGYTTERDLPNSWGGDNQENVLWQTPLIGEGHASPIVWGDRVFVCTARWPDNVRKREEVIPEHHVLCYAAGDGKLLWDTRVPPGPWLRTDFRSGPGGGYACPTPTTDGRLVYCGFGSSVLAALDFQGRIVWRVEIVPHTFDVTLGSSPVLYKNALILLCAMAKSSDSKIIAFNKATGNILWQQALPETKFGHSTPVLLPVRGKKQLIFSASGMGPSDQALQSFDPENGNRLWWCWGAGDAASPAYGGGILYFDSGRGGPGVAVDPTGSGDVSQTHVRWKISQVPTGIGSPVIVGDHVYRLHSPGILKCWDRKSGQRIYAERLEGITTTWASPVVDPNGRIFFANSGKSFVLQAGPGCKVLAVNELGDPNHTSPAVSGGKMYLVGTKYVTCIRKSGR